MSVDDRSTFRAFVWLFGCTIALSLPGRSQVVAAELPTHSAQSGRSAGETTLATTSATEAGVSSALDPLRWHRESALLVAEDAAAFPFGLAARSSGSSTDLTPRLDQVLKYAGPEESVPVIIYFQTQGLPEFDRTRIRALPRELRKEEGALELRRRAERSQAPTRAFLRGLEASGEATNVRSLWLVNAVAAHMTASRVYELLSLPDVRRVDWDPILDTQNVFDEDDSVRGACARVSGAAATGADEPSAGSNDLASGAGATGVSGSGLGNPSPSSGYTRGDDLDPTIFSELYRIRATDCWVAGYDGTGVLVAVLDEGFDYTHPDVAARVYTNPGEIPGNSVDDDGNGFIDDVHGWDFVNNDNDPLLTSGNEHGTNVLGLLAGNGANGFVTGVAKGATYLPIASVSPSFSASTWFAGFDYAALMGADVVVMSSTQKWSPSSKPDFDAWREVVENELTLGLIHINSAGNRGLLTYESPTPFNIGAPANSPSPWAGPYDYHVGGRTAVVAVGALEETDEIRDTSSRGPSAWEDISFNWPVYPYSIRPEYRDFPWSDGSGGLLKPDLCAPGTELKTLYFGGAYVDRSGTSFSTPYVGGAVAILLQARPSLTPEQIDEALQMSATDLGDEGKDPVYGAGMLDCYGALQYALDLDDQSYLDGVVRSAASLDSLGGATVTMLVPTRTYRTREDGRFRLPVNAGLRSLIIEHYGFRPDTLTMNVPVGTVVAFVADLDTLATGSITGVVRGPSAEPLPGAKVSIVGTDITTAADETGVYRFDDVPGDQLLQLEAYKFNYSVVSDTLTLEIGVTDTLDFELAIGLWDDFERDQGWVVGDFGDQALRGVWERSDPNGTYDGTDPVQPEDDFSAFGTLCYHTENSHVGAGPLVSEVGRGRTTLLSPIFDGTVYDDPYLSYARWLSNDTDLDPNNDANSLRILLSSNGGENWTEVDAPGTSSAGWNEVSIHVTDFVALSDSMQIRVLAYDATTAGIVEAAIDDIRMVEDTSDLTDPNFGEVGTRFVLALAPGAPNPFRDETTLRFQVPATDEVHLDVYDVGGRRVRQLVTGSVEAGVHTVKWDGRDDRGSVVASGLYFYRLSQGGDYVTGRALRMR
ncbi:MAG: S8 family serine peptidase [Candidatus Eisenbacteria bacterium]|uniref:S8 family serine peptidase n=1 Tax=Eiseniibacteriota bacterium TaxID=2212470 RepID=A0A956N8T1_UNCEI|nr:S8 family serine peptidase [Candidatus Eisenbacteria bacterium]